MLDDESLDDLTEVGAADGAVREFSHGIVCACLLYLPLVSLL